MLWGIAAGLVLGSLVTGVTIWKLLRPAPSTPLARFALSPPEVQQFGGGVGPSLALSPDGRWLAYGSGESGHFEVYVRPFPGPGGGKWQISTEGGSQPLWAPNGGELFYRSGDKLIAVAVETEPIFKVGNQKVLFKAKGYVGWPLFTSYDIHPDGKRFVMVKSEEVSPDLVVVLNWFEELRRRVPPGD